MIEKINFNGRDNVKPVVLVAPLDWGLGHASRCIPIIHECLNADFEVIIAASGQQQKLLKNEFPFLEIIPLPGYGLSYGKNRWTTIVKLLLQAPKILIAINHENKWLNDLVKLKPLDIIISDNRYGLYHSNAYTVFITHQLRIKVPGSKWVERLLQKINYRFINKFNQCWIPDTGSELNLAGTLSHPVTMPRIPVTYIGALSRIKKLSLPVTNKLLVILSGPEPQRSLLENKILEQLNKLQLQAILVRGLPTQPGTIQTYPQLQVFDHLDSKQMQEVIAQSAVIISRPGYSTVMDLLPIGKKCIFIPTPGQTEQEYLAEYLAGKGWCYTTSQDKLQLEESIRKVQGIVIPDLSAACEPGQLKQAITGLRDKGERS